MENVKYPIPQRHLTTAIESLKELALRLEVEAGALAQLPTIAATDLAQELLERARTVREACDYFLGL